MFGPKEWFSAHSIKYGKGRELHINLFSLLFYPHGLKSSVHHANLQETSYSTSFLLCSQPVFLYFIIIDFDFPLTKEPHFLKKRFKVHLKFLFPRCILNIFLKTWRDSCLFSTSFYKGYVFHNIYWKAHEISCYLW